jgi:hypothetical protein
MQYLLLHGKKESGADVGKKLGGIVVGVTLCALLVAAGAAPAAPTRPAVRAVRESIENMKVVSKLRLTRKSEGITDVYALNGYAYVGTWYPKCPKAGVHVVDVRNPEAPKKVAFVSSGRHDYVSEGVFAMHMDTEDFTGDILVMDHEACDNKYLGGISIWNVTDPAHPKPLARGVGDRVRNHPTNPRTKRHASSSHSAMAWQAGAKAYAVLVDNEERLDVDILDITDPRSPQLIGEFGLDDWPQAKNEQSRGMGAFISASFHHDMWVKEIEGHFYMLLSYWDAGWILLNVDDPANPVYLDDFDYESVDPLFGMPPEGDAHQGMWSTDNQYILAADEDFTPIGFFLEIEDGPSPGLFRAQEFYGARFIAGEYPDKRINGPTPYGGRGCSRRVIPSPSGLDRRAGEEKILVVQRGGECNFLKKVKLAQKAGYDSLLVAADHEASRGGEAPDAHRCPFVFPRKRARINVACVGHRAFHLIYGTEPTYEGEETAPQPGALGARIDAGQGFDGWGYLHLLDATTLEEIDSYAIPNASSLPARPFARQLSIHEIKPDPRPEVHLAYASWYGGGARVIRFGPEGLEEVGHYTRGKATDFWGTFPLAREGRRPLLLFSDRSFGLIALEYTGPE